MQKLLDTETEEDCIPRRRAWIDETLSQFRRLHIPWYIVRVRVALNIVLYEGAWECPTACGGDESGIAPGFPKGRSILFIMGGVNALHVKASRAAYEGTGGDRRDRRSGVRCACPTNYYFVRL